MHFRLKGDIHEERIWILDSESSKAMNINSHMVYFKKIVWIIP